MLLQLDPHSGVPMYRQMMDQIRFHMASGLLKPGDELPSIRNLSADLGINPMTISKAYAYLERDGHILRRPGRPLVVREQKAEDQQENRFDQLRAALRPVVVMARQLALSREECLDLFGELLDEDPP